MDSLYLLCQRCIYQNKIPTDDLSWNTKAVFDRINGYVNIFSSVIVGDTESVKIMLDLNSSAKNHTLPWAASNGNLKIVKYLVEKGADIHDNDDITLRWASYYGHFEIVKYLVEKGADIHANDDIAFQHASYCGHLEIVKFLVDHGVDIHTDNDIALRSAVMNKHFEVVKYLKSLP